MNAKRVQELITELLKEMGEDPNREAEPKEAEEAAHQERAGEWARTAQPHGEEACQEEDVPEAGGREDTGGESAAPAT